MAAILTDRLLSPRAGPSTTAFSRPSRRCLFDLSGTLTIICRVVCEGLVFLWMLTAAAFSLLMAAGTVGVL